MTTIERLKKDLGNYSFWTNAKRYSFENMIVFGLGLIISLFADPMYNILNTLTGGQATHPLNLGIGQIIAVLVCTFFFIQNTIRWRES